MAWFVSHCKAPSRRDEYVDKMSKTAHVDIYGKCSENFSIERGSTREQKELSEYKFYIAFENSKCPEYVTEKLYKILNSNIRNIPPVPIVMGPNRSWYVEHLPAKSFIHVDDFHDPEELGSYVKYLDSQDNLLLKHLYWRRYHKLQCEISIRCKLCDMLLTNCFQQQKNLLIPDFESFWHRAKCQN